MNVAVFARLLPRARLLAAAMAGVALVLVGSVAGATRIRSFAEDQLFADAVVYWEQTPYQRLVLTRDDQRGKHRLYIDGHIQFAETDEYRYHEALVHPLMSLPGPRARVLVLGGGDGLATRELLEYDEVERIDIVDLDPSVTRLCANYPPIRELNGGALRHDKVALHHMDAFAYVRETTELYQRVVIDLPDPHNEALNKLYSKEFYRLVRRRLLPGGYLVTQSSSPYFTREVFWGIAATLRAAGFDTHSYQIVVPSFGLWGFTLAARDGRVPTEFRITEASRFLDDRVMAQASVFPRDVGPIDVPVNSVFEPTLYPLYRRGRVDSRGENHVGAQ